MSKGCTAPATTTSPEGSTASDVSWQGLGVTIVRKFLYRMRSNARTVPSSEAHGATHSYSVIVGREPSCAQFRVENAAALTSCLSMLTESDGQSSSRDSTAQSLFSSSS